MTKGLLLLAQDDVEQGLRRVEDALRTLRSHDLVDPFEVGGLVCLCELLRCQSAAFFFESTGQPTGGSGSPKPAVACPRTSGGLNEARTRAL